MAWAIAEKYQGVSGEEDGSIDVIFIVDGTDDANGGNESAAIAALLAFAPTTRNGLNREAPPKVPRMEEIADKIWFGTVRYVTAEGGDVSSGGTVASFNTGGGSVHITQSKTSVHTYRNGLDFDGSPFYGAIGLSRGQDDPAGTDIVIPVFEYEETHLKTNAQVTDIYLGTLFELTGSVNDNFFKSFDTHECLFLGASGGKASVGGDWTITYKFAGSPNAFAPNTLPVGDIPGIEKAGWDYLWIYYDLVDDTTNMMLTARPKYAITERVYDRKNLEALAIGAARV